MRAAFQSWTVTQNLNVVYRFHCTSANSWACAAAAAAAAPACGASATAAAAAAGGAAAARDLGHCWSRHPQRLKHISHLTLLRASSSKLTLLLELAAGWFS